MLVGSNALPTNHLDESSRHTRTIAGSFSFNSAETDPFIARKKLLVQYHLGRAHELQGERKRQECSVSMQIDNIATFWALL